MEPPDDPPDEPPDDPPEDPPLDPPNEPPLEPPKSPKRSAWLGRASVETIAPASNAATINLRPRRSMCESSLSVSQLANDVEPRLLRARDTATLVVAIVIALMPVERRRSRGLRRASLLRNDL